MADGESTRVGVDVGGTFTDVVTISDGQVRVAKTPSTPETPERGVLTGVESLHERGDLDFARVGFFAHGTTVATNAVLEGEWADTALVTTEGFRDVLEIGRQNRPDIYDFQAEKPTPVVERDRRFEVPERLDERGNVRTPIDEAAVRDLAPTLDDAGVEGIAVSLLFAFENDDHERLVRDVLVEEGIEASFSLSSRVLPEIREYERTLTTALNAALKPVMDTYVGNLETEVREGGIDTNLKIMQSNGGIITAEAARDRPVNTLLSGPAAGVQGATYVAGLAGIDDVITMDMGGTSCDVSLVRGGDPLVSTDVTVGDYPVGVPMIDVHTLGAGGGSVAWLDAGGALRVGPRSAGADPGPICYGQGGTAPTTTDAHYVLGRIDPGGFLGDTGGAEEAVREAIEREIAGPLDMAVEEAAQGILDVANANMSRALRVVSVERGYDPREFGLVAFGGAGGLHATKLAAELDVPRVVVPRTAGVLSALGLLISDVIYDYSASRVRSLADVSATDLQAVYEEFEERGRERLQAEDLDPDRVSFERVADLRYVGQSFELPVTVPDGDLDDSTLELLKERFDERHRQRYGHAYEDEPLELVTVRLRARGVVETPDLRPEDAGGTAEDAITDTRTVVFDGDAHDTRVYDRELLGVEATFDGPGIVEGSVGTVVVHPGQVATVDEYANLLVEVA